MEETRVLPKLPDHPAFTPSPKHHPVANFFGALLALLVIAGGGYAMYVWQHQKVMDSTAVVQILQTQAHALQQQIDAAKAGASSSSIRVLPQAQAAGITLNNGSVSFSLPSGWVKATAAGLDSQCISPATSNVSCEDVSVVVPSTLNSDASPFSLNVREYQNASNATARDWFLKDYNGGEAQPAEGDQTSTANINGYSAYYYLQNVPNNYKDVYYVIASHGHSVVLYARVYELGTNTKATPEDFTQYLPAIQTFANSVKFES